MPSPEPPEASVCGRDSSARREVTERAAEAAAGLLRVPAPCALRMLNTGKSEPSGERGNDQNVPTKPVIQASGLTIDALGIRTLALWLPCPLAVSARQAAARSQIIDVHVPLSARRRHNVVIHPSRRLDAAEMTAEGCHGGESLGFGHRGCLIAGSGQQARVRRRPCNVKDGVGMRRKIVCRSGNVCGLEVRKGTESKTWAPTPTHRLAPALWYRSP